MLIAEPHSGLVFVCVAYVCVVCFHSFQSQQLWQPQVHYIILIKLVVDVILDLDYGHQLDVCLNKYDLFN